MEACKDIAGGLMLAGMWVLLYVGVAVL